MTPGTDDTSRSPPSRSPAAPPSPVPSSPTATSRPGSNDFTHPLISRVQFTSVSRSHRGSFASSHARIAGDPRCRDHDLRRPLLIERARPRIPVELLDRPRDPEFLQPPRRAAEIRPVILQRQDQPYPLRLRVLDTTRRPVGPKPQTRATPPRARICPQHRQPRLPRAPGQKVTVRPMDRKHPFATLVN